jgi:hypothetical protein
MDWIDATQSPGLHIQVLTRFLLENFWLPHREFKTLVIVIAATIHNYPIDTMDYSCGKPRERPNNDEY